MSAVTDCPCGSTQAFAACCEPYIAGKAQAPTAEVLMRARYSSYATGRIDVIEKTHAPESRVASDRKGAEEGGKDAQWKGLEILAVKGGTPADAEGVVNFVARFSTGGKDYEHREIATFRRHAGAWWFVDGKSPKPDTVVKSGPDV